MARTPEQVKADEALTEAIETAQRAYYGDDIDGVLTTYLVVAKRKWWGEEEGTYVGYHRLVKDNDGPLDEQLGLLEYTAARVRKIINEDGDE